MRLVRILLFTPPYFYAHFFNPPLATLVWPGIRPLPRCLAFLLPSPSHCLAPYSLLLSASSPPLSFASHRSHHRYCFICCLSPPPLPPLLRARGRVCRTNLPSNTAFRGFGGPQGMMVGEMVMDHVIRCVRGCVVWLYLFFVCIVVCMWIFFIRTVLIS